MADQIRTLPSIAVGSDSNLANIDQLSRVIIQEKIDGSQLTIFKKNGQLHYYNKNKAISPSRKPFQNAWLSLQDKPDIFQEGLFYHGEAMTSRLTNTVEYQRPPKYFWIIYEIVDKNNHLLTPEEMIDVLKDTGLETVPIIYDSAKDALTTKLADKVQELLTAIEKGQLISGLGGCPEGIVLKLQRQVDGKNIISRFKFVRQVFSEMNQQKKKRLEDVSNEEFIQALGDVYNTDARKQKAIQHLQENGKWKEQKIMSNMSALVNELDNDLLKEATEDIKTMLFIRFWPEISKAARGDLHTYLIDKFGKNQQ